MLLTNDTIPHVVHPELEANLNIPPLPYVEEFVVKLTLHPFLGDIDFDNKFALICTNYKEYHILLDHYELILKSLNENI